jgi:hypothetical protein
MFSKHFYSYGRRPEILPLVAQLLPLSNEQAIFLSEASSVLTDVLADGGQELRLRAVW